jgi:hypothetical protein
MGDEPRLLGVQLQLDACGQEGEAFEKALDIGVGDLHAFQSEPGRDFRKVLRELGAHLA